MVGNGHGGSDTGPGTRSGALSAVKLIVLWVGLLWVLEAFDYLSGHALDTFGIRPRRIGELVDIVPSAFMHFGFEHLLANTLPLLVLGFLAALRGVGRFLAVALIVIVASGLGVWL